MQQTFQLNGRNFNTDFIESVRKIFGNRDIKIVIEAVDKNDKFSQTELYQRSIPVLERFKDVKVDPNLDLSALANEVNL